LADDDGCTRQLLHRREELVIVQQERRAEESGAYGAVTPPPWLSARGEIVDAIDQALQHVAPKENVVANGIRRERPIEGVGELRSTVRGHDTTLSAFSADRLSRA